MADEKLNTGPAENTSPEAAGPITTPEQAAASEPDDVVVSFDKINELMAEKRQNACAEVEKAAPDKPKPSKRDKVSRSDGKAPDAKEPIKPAQDTAPKETAAVEQTAPEPTTPPRPVEEGKLVYLKLSEVHPFHTFRPHPFKVRDDAKMQEIVASIRVNGVMVPGLARPEKDGNGYEIVAGHRRTHGSELAGLDEMPFIVREMTDHEAVQAMKDSNKQRDGMLPSELAALLELEVEDIKHQGGRLKGVAEGDVGKRSVEIVGEAHEMNYKKVMRYLRLNSLVPELLDKVDDKKMGFMPAVELSYIKPKNQRLIVVSIDGEQASPSLAQAKRLRELDKEGKLNGDVIDGILSEQKKEDRGVIISTAELEKYFGKEIMSREQQIELLQDFIREQFISDGMCADAAIHDTDGHNPHAHILLTVRPLDEQGHWQYKTEKEYLCVRNGEEKGFTAAEFKSAQNDGWEKQYPYKVDKKKVYMTPPATADRIQSPNAGTVRNSF